jgi:hypothetical protein
MTMTPEIRDALSAGRLGHLSTLNPDGSPQVSVVWVGVEGEEVVIGHLMGGAKVRNIARDPRVALTLEVAGANPIGMTNLPRRLRTRPPRRGRRPRLAPATRRGVRRVGREVPPDAQSPARSRHPHHSRAIRGRGALVQVTKSNDAVYFFAMIFSLCNVGPVGAKP